MPEDNDDDDDNGPLPCDWPFHCCQSCSLSICLIIVLTIATIIATIIAVAATNRPWCCRRRRGSPVAPTCSNVVLRTSSTVCSSSAWYGARPSMLLPSSITQSPPATPSAETPNGQKEPPPGQPYRQPGQPSITQRPRLTKVDRHGILRSTGLINPAQIHMSASSFHRDAPLPCLDYIRLSLVLHTPRN